MPAYEGRSGKEAINCLSEGSVCGVQKPASVIHMDVALASESRHNRSNAPSNKSPLVDEERMRSGHWLRLVL